MPHMSHICWDSPPLNFEYTQYIGREKKKKGYWQLRTPFRNYEDFNLSVFLSSTSTGGGCGAAGGGAVRLLLL